MVFRHKIKISILSDGLSQLKICTYYIFLHTVWWQWGPKSVL